MAKCKFITGQTPYSADGCASAAIFAVNTHLNGNKSGDVIADIAYRKELSNYILNCGEGPGSFDNIMKLFPAEKVKVKAKEFYQRHMSEVNYTVYAAQAATATAGNPATLVIAAKSHLNAGTASLLNQGYTAINQRTGQVFQVESATKSTAYGHSASIRSYDNGAISIKAGDPIFIFATRIIGDVACSTLPSTRMRDMGYTTMSTPFRFETSWCMEHGVDIQNEVYQLDLIDNQGNRFQSWDPVVRSNSRREMAIARTIYFFFGKKITNPNITAQGNFKGWTGYLDTMRYGGGNYQAIPMTGITVREFDMIETRAVSMGIKEFVWYLPHEQRNNLETNLNLLFSTAAGSCTFETFRRAGDNSQDGRNGSLVTQLGVSSLKRNGITHHFMTADWANETNGLGNGILKDAIFVIPTIGAKDINGNEVPTFEMLEFAENIGQHHYRYEETYDDLSQRGPDFCEKSMGVIRDTMWLKINCLQNHWQFQPSFNC
jgi:hypothetical protein